MVKLKKQESYSDAELATIVGKSRNYITEILSIATLPEEVLDQCKQLGIDNKNLMIQVVQAHRKGNIAPFLKAYQDGQIQTVRAARSFNQQPKSSSPTPNQVQTKKPESSAKSSSPIVSRQGKEIRVLCSSEQEARNLAKKIKTLAGRTGGQ